MPTFGSETYRSQNALESIKPRETFPYFLQSESIRGPDSLPEIGRLQPNTAAAGAGQPDFQLTVIGAGFLKANSVIVINGVEQLTTFVNSNTLRTMVQPSSVQSPLPFVVAVSVRNNKTSSLDKPFTFTP